MPSTTAVNSSKKRASEASAAPEKVPRANVNDKVAAAAATISNGKLKPETVANERENFLAAFEKPTQIYKFLRDQAAKNASPIFLQRNLSYNQHFFKPKKRNPRKSFDIHGILKKLEMKQPDQVIERSKVKYLNLILDGFKDSDKWVEGTIVRVHVKVGRAACRKIKRKSNQVISSVTIVYEETKEITIRKEPLQECPCFSIPTTIFAPYNGEVASEVHLFFQVALPPSALRKNGEISDGRENGIYKDSRVKNGKVLHKSSSLHPNNSNGITSSSSNENGEPKSKKLKLDECAQDKMHFAGHITLLDKDVKLELDNFDYEVFLKPVLAEPKKKKLCASWVAATELPNGIKAAIEVKEPKLSVILGVFLRVSSEVMAAKNGFVPRPTVCSVKVETNGDHPVNGASPAGENEVDRKPVIYQFVYNSSRQQTEAHDDLRCPWCSLDCRQLYPLLKHLKLCHPRFSFVYTSFKGGHRIDVSINKSYDGSYDGSAFDLIQHPPGNSFSRNGPSRRTKISSILVSHPKRPKPSLDEFKDHEEDKEPELRRPYIAGHNRLYHHTSTTMPIHPKELDEDSEGEYDPEWLKIKTFMMIDEFTDVNEGEKELMKMWNLHVLKYNYVGDCQIPLACRQFVEKQGNEIIKKNLYRNFVAHLTSLFDFRLLDATNMFKIIKQLHRQMKESKNYDHLRHSWESHRLGYRFARNNHT